MENLKEKKLALAKALEDEHNNLPSTSLFGDDNDVDNYEVTIKYLKTGEHPEDYYDNDLLCTCIEDIETMFIDYL